MEERRIYSDASQTGLLSERPDALLSRKYLEEIPSKKKRYLYYSYFYRNFLDVSLLTADPGVSSSVPDVKS